MFFASLMMAGFQLGAATVVYGIARMGTTKGWCAALAAGLFGLMLLSAMMPNGVLILQGIALAVIGMACVGAKARHWVFAGWAAVATMVVLGVVGGLGARSWAGFKERYPFESMRERLAYEAKTAAGGESVPQAAQRPASLILPEATLTRLNEAKEGERWWRGRRSEALRLVHASHVEQFIESPGFGVGRMIRPSPYAITSGDKRAMAFYELDRLPDWDGSREPGAESNPGEAFAGATSIFSDALNELHDEARRDFLDLNAFGYIRDREHVAGFVPHAFLNELRRFWPAQQRWLTTRVELVSMLKHEQPMIYVSGHLPNMSELREAPIRELDSFERQALAALIDGDDVVSDLQVNRIRALGSLRAATKCLECHEAQRGELLGAFSYEFLRDSPVRRKTNNAPAAAAHQGKLLDQLNCRQVFRPAYFPAA